MMSKIDVALPPEWLKKIDEIVEDEATHYQKRADVVRKALSTYLYPAKVG